MSVHDTAARLRELAQATLDWDGCPTCDEYGNDAMYDLAEGVMAALDRVDALEAERWRLRITLGAMVQEAMRRGISLEVLVGSVPVPEEQKP